MDIGVEDFGNTNRLNLLKSEFLSSTEAYVDHPRGWMFQLLNRADARLRHMIVN